MSIRAFPQTFSIRWVVTAVAALALLGLVVTLGRVPLLRNDSQLYAAIARSRQLVGNGVPSTLWSAPSPVDHIPFYGPVYFDLQATAFRLFGVSASSARLLSLLGALMVCAGGAILANTLSHSRDRGLWAFTLLLLTPEIGTMATRGDMEAIAVGFEVMALAIFVAGLTRDARADGHGALAGGALSLAALTTPRTFPFIFAFVVSGIWLYLISGRTPEARRQFIVAMLVLSASFCAWTVWSHGSPFRWVRFMWVILTHEDTDVALVPTAIRWWQFSWSLAITPLFAVAAALVAASRMARHRDEVGHASHAIAFALLVAAVAGVLTFCGMNLTFLWGGYFALPLLAVVLALPYRELQVRRVVLALGVALLLAGDVGAAAPKYARAAASWSAHDPRPIDQLVRTHVPPGSGVIGPDWLYFFAVEGSGARYISAYQESVADWTRWMPIAAPSAARARRQFPATPASPRFLIWADGEQVPDRYLCALDHAIADYHPPADHLDRLGRFGETWDRGFPVTTLYQLPVGCPARNE